MPFIVFLAIAAGCGSLFVTARIDSDDGIDDDVSATTFAVPSLPFDGPRQLGAPLEVGAPVGNLLPGGSVGEHALPATEGQLTITVEGADAFDAVVQVIATDGQVLGQDDDSGGSRDAQLSLRLPGGTGATVLVREFGGEAGAYLVRLERGDGSGGEPRQGPALAVGTPQGGSVATDEVVAHPFVAPGGTFVVTVEGLAGFDPMVLVRSAGEVLAQNDDADGTNSRVTLSLPEGRQVSIEVSGFGGRGGSYEVLVR